ncbi:MAG: diguanylate cyclase [Chloroflexi bacterium]|nr:diguanylate cyclase [Chloroflexota bacterium]
MELRQYVYILLSKWWIILPLALMGFTYSLVFSYSQTPTYEAASTYVTRLDTALSDDLDTTIFGVETLTGRERIFVTYCELMTSKAVRYDAYRLMNLDPVQVDLEAVDEDYDVTCANLPETNVLLLTVRGPSPEFVARLNEAVGLTGSARANRLYSYFPLENLDPVDLEEDPVAPGYVQNGVLGGALGLVVGITLAFAIEYFQSPSKRLEQLSIRHPQLGIYNQRYFRQRFEEEINRAYARNRPISMALLQLTPNEDFELLPESVQVALTRAAALMIQDTLSQGAIVAYMRPRTFGILLAETPGDEARRTLEKLHTILRTQTFESGGYVSGFVARSGLVVSSGNALNYQEMLDKASEALKRADATGENSIYIIRAIPQPFVMPQQDADDDFDSFDDYSAYDDLGWDSTGEEPALVAGDTEPVTVPEGYQGEVVDHSAQTPEMATGEDTASSVEAAPEGSFLRRWIRGSGNIPDEAQGERNEDDR